LHRLRRFVNDAIEFLHDVFVRGDATGLGIFLAASDCRDKRGLFSNIAPYRFFYNPRALTP
jgi:hypothetical protein